MLKSRDYAPDLPWAIIGQRKVSEGFGNTEDEDILRVFQVCLWHVLGHRQTYIHATYARI
jgi:hypothetical protein